MAAETPGICDECDEPVYPSGIAKHMALHGLLSPDEWRLKTWPDGTTVLLDFSFLRDIGKA